MNNKSFLISGHADFGRLETLRDYLLLKKVKFLVVLYFNLAFSNNSRSRIEVYENGRIKINFTIFNYIFKNNSKYKYILIFYTYFTYFFSIIKIYFIIKKKNIDFYIGIGTLIAFLTRIIFFVTSKKNSKFIFYCIDYFDRFNYLDDFLKIKFFINYLEQKIQFYLLKKSDFIWEISKAISIARNKSINISIKKELNRHIFNKRFIIPLGYSITLLKKISSINIENKNKLLKIVFIGVINPNQCLDELAEAIKIRSEFFINKIHIHVIGDGPYLSGFKSNLIKKKITNFFSIHGYLDLSKTSKIISGADYGYAIFPSFKGNHSLNAEPGKIKMYYIFNKPCIISNNIYLSKLIKRYKSGIVLKKIDSNLISRKLMKLVKYRSFYNNKFKKNILNFKNNECVADIHFDKFFNNIIF
jgi:glycosyltransferase involved in cell wall biosynthesis